MPLFPPQDRLVRKEVALGTIREFLLPSTQIGLTDIAPFLEVASDDVIFDYTRGLTDGLAPARAEDAESELAQKDLIFGGVGRASVLDWALKDHYTASDVMNYREALMIAATLGINNINVYAPITIAGTINEFANKIARDDVLRRRKIDNRLEWMIMTALETSKIAYNDGRIQFAVDYGRPANQTDQAPAGGLWNLTTSDPIGAIVGIQNFMYDTYGIHMTRAIAGRKVLLALMNSDRFAARAGFTGATGGTTVDPRYQIDGWGPLAAMTVVERQTGITFTQYDAVYRTRPVGSTTITSNRFLSSKKVFLLPDPEDVDALDNAIGFGRTLTSPHPEGLWQPGYYEWEEETRDPWGQNRGTGIKAFPVFPHMDWTYTMQVLP